MDTCYSSGMAHIRLNVLVSKSEEGGNPIWRDADNISWRQEVELNQAWFSLAGDYKHSTTATKGKTPRILLSFGYDVPRAYLKTMIKPVIDNLVCHETQNTFAFSQINLDENV